MRATSSGSTRIHFYRLINASYPLTFLMAQKVINPNIEREVALLAMQRLHSCYANVILILKSNKVRTLCALLNPGINPSRIILPRKHRISEQRRDISLNIPLFIKYQYLEGGRVSVSTAP